jgi:uncharacterized membrane protein YcaP (DUF421 family)
VEADLVNYTVHGSGTQVTRRDDVVMSQQLGTSWSNVALVVVSTVSIYAAFVILVRVMGQRSLATMAAFDLALVVAVGSLIARTSLLRDPTLAQGLVALLTLFALQAAVAFLRRFAVVDHLVTTQPILLVKDGEVLHEQLRHARLLEKDLRQKLRLAGVGSLAAVQCAVLERNGVISVIRHGTATQSDVMIDVAGAPITDPPLTSSTGPIRKPV